MHVCVWCMWGGEFGVVAHVRWCMCGVEFGVVAHVRWCMCGVEFGVVLHVRWCMCGGACVVVHVCSMCGAPPYYRETVFQVSITNANQPISLRAPDFTPHGNDADSVLAKPHSLGLA